MAQPPPKEAFRVLEATERDVPRLMEIQFAAFAQEPADQIFNGTDTPENQGKAGARLLNQMRIDPSLHTVKAVLLATSDPTTTMNFKETEETTVGFCMWHIYDKPRPRDEWMAEHPMLTCAWLTPAAVRDKARTSFVAPLTAGRRRMEGQPHALLMYMCVDPAWQRRGAGRMLMQWGTHRCDELGIPAYLEASPFGYPLYRGCGFEDYEPLVMTTAEGREMTFPTMLRRPAPRREEEA